MILCQAVTNRVGIMELIGRLVDTIDRLTELSGRALKWLGLPMMLVTVAVVVLRYGFNIGWIAMQESVLYLHTTVFMLAMGYTLKHDGHVRVDVFYREFSKRTKAWVDLVGTLVLLVPVCIFIGWVSLDYVASSWELKEASMEAGGLPGVYLLKSLILLMTGTVLLQGIAEALRNLLVILDTRGETGPNTGGKLDD